MFLPWYSHAGPTGRGTIIAILPEPAPCQADDNTGQLLAPARPEQIGLEQQLGTLGAQ